MWFLSLLKKYNASQDRLRRFRHRSKRRLLVESLEGRSLLASVPLEFFDAVTVPNLPTNWTAVHTGAGAPWATVSSGSHSPNNHAFISNPATGSEGILTSPLFVPTAATMQLSFRNSYNTQLNADGGVLEVSIGVVPAFVDILAAGGSFITGGYNSTLGAGGVLNGRQAWSGNSNGYILTTIQLPASALGQPVQVRGRFASNPSVGGVGWRIDTISTESSNAPVIDSIGAAVSYTENTPRVLVFPSATITDSDTVNFASAALTVANTNAQATDSLAIVPNAQVTVSGANVAFNATNIGTFTGGVGATPMVFNFNSQALISHVQSVLKAIGFANSSEAPVTTARNISVQVTDGKGGISVPKTKQVNLISVNDAPVIGSIGIASNYIANGPRVLVFPTATITDIDTVNFANAVLTVTNTNGQLTDSLAIIPTANITVSGANVLFNGTIVGSFTGGTGANPLAFTFNNQSNFARVQFVLNAIGFASSLASPITTSRAVSVRVTDGIGGTSTLQNKLVNVALPNQIPVIGSIGAAVRYNPNGPRVLVFPTATITDPDTVNFANAVLTVTNTNGQATDSLAIIPTATITVSGANVLFNGTIMGTFTGGVGTTPLAFTFNNQASFARVQFVLNTIGFASSLAAPTTTARTISVRVTDGVGGTSTLQSKLVNINQVPVIGSIGPAASYNKTTGVRVSVFPTATITDPDTVNFANAVLTVTNTNGQATDSLAIIPTATITVSGANVLFNGTIMGSFTGGTGTTPLAFTFNNQASFARVQLVLNAVGFASSLSVPSSTPRTISVRVNDGIGGTSALQSKLVNII